MQSPKVIAINNAFPEDPTDTYFGTMNILVSEHCRYFANSGFPCLAIGLHALNRPSRFVHNYTNKDGTRVSETVFWRKLEKRGVDVRIPAVLTALYVRSKYRKMHATTPILAHNTLWSGIVAYYTKKLFGLPYILIEHFSWFATNNVPSKYIDLARRALQAADAVYAVSQPLQQTLIDYVGNSEFRCNIMPNVVDTNVFRPGLNEQRPHVPFRLACISALKQKKRVDLAINLVNRLNSKGIRCELQVVGRGPIQPQLIDMARDHSLPAETVTFRGYLDKPQIAELLRTVDALVVTSTYETFCIPVIEAHCMGIPVITTPCKGPEQLIDPSNGRVARDLSVESLEAEVRHIINNYSTYDPEVIRKRALSRYAIDVVLDKFIADHLTPNRV
jgi:glycosyltransferase involved in cell wall biosynthesis